MTTADLVIARLREAGVGLPVHVGLPGPVSRQKLMRISANIGLGQSARFPRKQRNVLWRLFLPGGYRPTRMARQFGTARARAGTNIRGLHVFTFNEFDRAERWRRELLSSIRVREDQA